MAGIARLIRRDADASRAQTVAVRAGGAAVVLGLVLVAAKVGGAPLPDLPGTEHDPAAVPDAQVRTAVTQVLQRRAAAVLGHDKAAYLATDAPGKWRTTDAQRFDSLMAVPLAGWTLALDPADTGVGHLYQVRQAYQISGADPQPVESTEYLSFVFRDGAWVVGSDSVATAAGKHSDVQLWDQGRVAVAHGGRSLVIGLGDAARLQTYADLADHGAAKAAQVWGAAGWHGTVVVEVPDTQAQAEALLGEQPGELTDVAALTSGEVGKSASSAPASRVLVNPDQFATLPPESWQVVIDHELTHVATRSWTTAGTPIWLSEGAADWSAYHGTSIAQSRMLRDLRDAAKQPGFQVGALPDDGRFGGDQAGVAYEESNLACRMIVEHYGQAKLVAFYKAVGLGVDGTAPAGSADPVDAAFRSVLGISEADFVARWQQYVLAKAKA